MIITSSNIFSPFLIDVRKIVAQDLRNPREAYNFAYGLNFDLTRLSPEQQKEIISAVSENSSWAYSFVYELKFDLTKIPQKLLMQ